VSERDGYQHGVPCWVDTLQPDPEEAMRFYMPLFGWEFEGPGPTTADAPGEYYVAQIGGRDVAAIGSQATEGAPAIPVWNTYVWVEDADGAAASARSAGGGVVAEAFDVLPAGRMAVLFDPAGACLRVWEAKDRKGAQRVNEPGAWAMSTLNTRHSEDAKAFYAAVFGWETDTFGLGKTAVTLWRVPGYEGGEPQQPVPRDVVGAMLPISSDESTGDPPAHWSVNFWVDDADATAHKAAELGGTIVVAPFDTPVDRTAVLADPQGAVFSVSKVNVGN
jgi:predicted enzyme related to lactoylglutathione lyase